MSPYPSGGDREQAMPATCWMLINTYIHTYISLNCFPLLYLPVLGAFINLFKAISCTLCLHERRDNEPARLYKARKLLRYEVLHIITIIAADIVRRHRNPKLSHTS